MLYLLESKITENKSIYYALREVFGLGKHKSAFICKKLGFSKVLQVKDLSRDQVSQVTKLIEALNIELGSKLKQLRLVVAKKLISIRSYRGIRRSQGLPVRGQRTHTNAKTARKN